MKNAAIDKIIAISLRRLLVILLFGFGICCLAGNSNAQPAVDLSRDMTPVKSQGRRNTCSVFAATSLMEYLIKQETGQDVDLSESFNYWAGKNYALNTNFLRKAYENMDGLAGFLAVEAYRHGSMLESDWPYDMQNWLQKQDPRCKKVAGKPSTECFTGAPPGGAQRLRYGILPIYLGTRKNTHRISRSRARH